MKFYANSFYFIVVFFLFGGVAFGQANPFQKVDTTKSRLKIKYKMVSQGYRYSFLHRERLKC
jgi:hypothetical protein